MSRQVRVDCYQMRKFITFAPEITFLLSQRRFEMQDGNKKSTSGGESVT